MGNGNDKPESNNMSSQQNIPNKTNFTETELKNLRDSFLKENPSGMLTPQRIHILYANMYPLGDAGAFSKLIFNATNTKNKTGVDFIEFIQVLDTLKKGSRDQKIQWIFKLCDQDKDGRVSRSELTQVITGLYQMKGDPEANRIAQSVAGTIFTDCPNMEDRVGHEAVPTQTGDAGLTLEEFTQVASKSPHLAGIVGSSP